jgi:hypothetical protein
MTVRVIRNVRRGPILLQKSKSCRTTNFSRERHSIHEIYDIHLKRYGKSTSSSAISAGQEVEGCIARFGIDHTFQPAAPSRAIISASQGTLRGAGGTLFTS